MTGLNVAYTLIWIDGTDSQMNFTRGNVFWILDEDTGIGEKGVSSNRSQVSEELRKLVLWRLL